MTPQSEANPSDDPRDRDAAHGAALSELSLASTDDATEPSLALAGVWELLDVLPAAKPSNDMMATTMELAAVPLGGGASAGVPSGALIGRGMFLPDGWSGWRRWLPAAVFVLGALVVGLAAGRATAPNPETAILANLPIVRHLDLLREVGSVAFLEAVAQGGYPPPRRPPVAKSAADVREDTEEFDAAIAALRAIGSGTVNRETLSLWRKQVLQMSDTDRRQLEKSAETFKRLSGADRRELAAVGTALADPSREQLLKAARLWHLWVQLRDPADRRDVIELTSDERLEALDRWTRINARMDPRQDGRDGMRPPFDRDWENRRRAPGQFGPPDFQGGPPPPGSPPRPRGPGQRPGSGGPGRGPGPGGGPGSGPEPGGQGGGPGGGMGQDRPSFNDRGPQPPAETPAPPR